MRFRDRTCQPRSSLAVRCFPVPCRLRRSLPPPPPPDFRARCTALFFMNLTSFFDVLCSTSGTEEDLDFATPPPGPITNGDLVDEHGNPFPGKEAGESYRWVESCVRMLVLMLILVPIGRTAMIRLDSCTCHGRKCQSGKRLKVSIVFLAKSWAQRMPSYTARPFPCVRLSRGLISSPLLRSCVYDAVACLPTPVEPCLRYGTTCTSAMVGGRSSSGATPTGCTRGRPQWKLLPTRDRADGRRFYESSFPSVMGEGVHRHSTCSRVLHGCPAFIPGSKREHLGRPLAVPTKTFCANDCPCRRP